MAEVWVDFIPSPSVGLKALTCIDYLIRLGWFCLWPWYWIFKVKWIWFALFQEKKWTEYHETKKEHIDWALDLKYIHHYLHAWPWPQIFKAKYWICYISGKKWSDCQEMKNKLSIEFETSKWLWLLSFSFQGEMFIQWAISLEKWSDRHKMKN